MVTEGQIDLVEGVAVDYLKGNNMAALIIPHVLFYQLSPW